MATKIFGCWNGATKILFVPGTESNSVASPWTAGANLLIKTLLFTVVTTFLSAGVKGGTHGTNGCHAWPSTVSGGNNAWINDNRFLFTKTFVDSNGDVTGFAGNKHGPLIDGLSFVFGPMSNGILLF